MPEEGVIPDAETAKQVAEVIFNRFYDPASVQMEKPFSVHLQDGNQAGWNAAGSGQNRVMKFVLKAVPVRRGSEPSRTCRARRSGFVG